MKQESRGFQSGPAGRLAALNASLCLGLCRNSDELRPLNGTQLTTNGREKGQHVIIFHSKVEICIAVSCRFSLLLLSFLPHVRTPASQGPTSPSSAPPRCQNNLATLPPPTETLLGGGSSRLLLPSRKQRTSTRQNNKSCASRSTHIVVDMRSTVLW